MKRSRVLMSAAALAGACVIGASLTGFTALDAEEVNAVDAVAAVQQVAPEAVSGAISTSSTSENAVDAKVNDSTVSVPTNPSDGVQVDAPGVSSDVTIGLPFANQASEATDSQAAGVVVYDNGNGSSTIPVVHQDGSLQIATVIDNASAPKRYEYTLEGKSIQLTSDGAAAVYDGEGQLTSVVEAPWAKDTNGNDVPTHFEVAGDTLTQVVDFDANTAFPVVADPKYWWGVQLVLTSAQVNKGLALHGGAVAAFGGVAAVCAFLTAGVCGVIAAVIAAAFGINAAIISWCNARGRGIYLNLYWAGAWTCSSR